MEKINVSELLKGCPSGMELDCTMYDDVYFDWVDELNIIHCYIQHETHKTSITFNQYGTHCSDIKSKCVIFPKGKTTWEGFQRPFKDGEIIATDLGSVFILKSCLEDEIHYHSYIGVTCCNDFQEKQIPFAYKYACHLATEEEKQKLFDSIKANGYKWNEETKTLEKLPKFKDGDIVTCKDGGLLVACIYKEREITESFNHHIAFYKGCLGVLVNGEIALTDDKLRFATEEEKAKLFKAIKYKGYKWNEETKTLDKLIQPKFKVGDKIFNVLRKRMGALGTFQGVISEITDDKYIFTDGSYMFIGSQDNYELVPVEPKFKVGDRIRTKKDAPIHLSNILITKVNKYSYEGVIGDTKNPAHINFKYQDLYELMPVGPKFKVGDTITNGKTSIKIGYIDNEYYYEISRNIANRLFIKFQDEWSLIDDKFPIKFNINTLVPFESKVLIRDTKSQKWSPAIWGFYDSDQQDYQYKLIGVIARYCIPYEGNEHLLGKTDDCNEYFKTWK